jgi:hypothetical protein
MVRRHHAGKRPRGILLASATCLAAAPLVGPADGLAGTRGLAGPRQVATIGQRVRAQSSPARRLRTSRPDQPRLGRVLFAPAFAPGTHLVTNDYAYFHASSPTSVQSADWFVTSGSLFARNGAGWTGTPDAAKPNAQSTNGTGSATFRVITRRRDFGSVAVSFDLLNQRSVTTYRTPAHHWDGVHVFLHYLSQNALYVVTVNRRDNTVVMKKKVPGGPTNGGTYYTLGAPVRFAPRHGRWQHVLATIRGNARHGVSITASVDGRLLLAATDRGLGGRPLGQPGAIGIRGDNTEFKFAHLLVRALR